MMGNLPGQGYKMTLTTIQFGEELLKGSWGFLLLAVILIFSDKLYLICKRGYLMTKRQIEKLKFRQRLFRQAKALEDEIMSSYLLEDKNSSILKPWQK